jgi:SAM-dependent methyltransferase
MERAQRYYDQFSQTYEEGRGHGYHQLIDDLELSVARRYCRGRVLEAGCGTGLILERLARQHPGSLGFDLSAGMLRKARDRRLHVVQSSVAAIPFASNRFDTVVSFKVLAHVPAIARSIAELARVTRPGGHLVLEFYNRYSVRALIKHLKRPTQIGRQYTDEDVFTRFDSGASIESYVPPWLEWVESRGVRVFTPLARVHDLPLMRDLFGWLERKATEHPAASLLAGFRIVVLRKRHS